MEKAGLKFGKFRTETPPRIDRKTMDFSRLKIQNYDAAPHMFSFDGEFDGRQQLNNYITYVEKDCIDYILANKNKSPVLLKKLGSFNPRYCPSIEDKVYRFELKQRHIIFIQPEGIKSNEMYLHGLFTTFSEDIQEGIIKKIIGLEKAQITRPGYGVEYDYLLPHQLRNSLECKQYNGLFFAGQITGTTGYEEAASQGILAGINAALYVKNEEPLIFKRKDGYLGILIDDIVNKGVNEPYRMLTSRNEFRLLHRHDNADIRMLPFIKKLKFYDRAEIIEKKYDKIYLALSEIRKSRYYKNKELLEQIRQDKLSDCDRNSIIGTFSLNSAEYESLIINIKYEIYFKREAQRIEDLEKDSGILIPKNIDFKSVKNLSIEAIEVLKKHQPETVGIAGNLPGIKPLDILSLIAHLKMFHVKH
jgi:tRNA uridine 5-carboxymethylaminomethyl modification enzyme